MMNIYKNVGFFRLNAALFALLLALTFGCARKENSLSSNNETQRKRSLELENSFRPEGIASASDEIQSEELVQPDVRAEENTIASSPEKSIAPAAGKASANKTEKRIEKLKKMIEKNTIKMQNKIEKGKAAGLNQNLKLGLILILIGILIAVLLGALVNGYVFGAIGTIVAVIGIVFVILGLMEM